MKEHDMGKCNVDFENLSMSNNDVRKFRVRSERSPAAVNVCNRFFTTTQS